MSSDDITKEMHNDQLAKILDAINAFGNKIASLETRVDHGLASLDSRVSALEAEVSKLAVKAAQTKPLWVDELNNRIDELSKRIDELNKKVDEGFREIGYKIGALNKQILQVVADQQYVEDRLDKLERG